MIRNQGLVSPNAEHFDTSQRAKESRPTSWAHRTKRALPRHVGHTSPPSPDKVRHSYTENFSLNFLLASPQLPLRVIDSLRIVESSICEERSDPDIQQAMRSIPSQKRQEACTILREQDRDAKQKTNRIQRLPYLKGNTYDWFSACKITTFP